MEYRRPVKPEHRGATPAPQQSAPTQSPTVTALNKQKPSRGKIAGIIAAFVILCTLVAGSIWLQQNDNVGAHIKSDRYQAVFFTNGQVYFGKLSVLSSGYYKLNDIYYLQSQTEDDVDNPQQTSEEGSADVQLIKLGSEIHGPEDEMIMSSDQVLFFENLKTDGRVTETIAEYAASQTE